MTTSIEGEDAIVQGYLAPLAAGFPGALGLRDDCAVLTPAAGMDLVLKCDPIAAGVHFFADDDPADIGWKALAVNVSDLAAKGARPLAYLMALSFPSAPAADWLVAFARGLGEAQTAFGLALAGGDTDRRPGPVTISITVIGEVPAGRMVRRGAAQPGHRVYVSGTIGDSHLGLRLRSGASIAGDAVLDAAARTTLVGRYLRPQPRLGLRTALLEHAAAAMDLSDGLVKDLGRMCRNSGVGAELQADTVPLSAAAATLVAHDPGLLPHLLTGGDDYEVLAAVAPGNCAAFEAAAASGSVSVKAIGEFVTGNAVQVTGASGEALRMDRAGYDHFEG